MSYVIHKPFNPNYPRQTAWDVRAASASRYPQIRMRLPAFDEPMVQGGRMVEMGGGGLNVPVRAIAPPRTSPITSRLGLFESITDEVSGAWATGKAALIVVAGFAIGYTGGYLYRELGSEG